LSSPDQAAQLGLFHRAFDKLYPAIRFTYERVLGHVWFTQITPRLWLGGAPTYRRDYQALLTLRITAVLDLRAERSDDIGFLDRHGITHRKIRVPDVTAPNEDALAEAVDWIDAQLADGRTVLVHCAKGRGRSAAVVAAYLMKADGMSFDEARRLLKSRRSLTKLEDRHRRAVESWIAKQPPAPTKAPA
jgi:rhodanese-related sulfurtransferase